MLIKSQKVIAMKNKFVKSSLAIMLALPFAFHVFAQNVATPKPATEQDQAKLTMIFNALSNSKDPQATIYELVCKGSNSSMAMPVASVAATLNIPLTTVQAGMSCVSADLADAYNDGLTNPTAFLPATAAGPQEAPQDATGFATSPASSLSGGGSVSVSTN